VVGKPRALTLDVVVDLWFGEHPVLKRVELRDLVPIEPDADTLLEHILPAGAVVELDVEKVTRAGRVHYVSTVWAVRGEERLDVRQFLIDQRKARVSGGG